MKKYYLLEYKSLDKDGESLEYLPSQHHLQKG